MSRSLRVLCVLATAACSRGTPPPTNPQPPPDPAAAAADAKARAFDESQRKLEASLAKLEQLKHQGDQPAPEKTAPPLVDPMPAMREVEASAGRAAQWAPVVALAKSQQVVEALVAAAKLCAAQKGPVPAEGVAALRQIQIAAWAQSKTRCDPTCAAAAGPLEELPETDANARPFIAAIWAALANRAATGGDVPFTRKLAKHALELEDSNPLAFAALARAAYSETDFDEAEKFWERAARASTDPEMARTFRAQLEAVQKERTTLGTGRKASEHFAVLYDPKQDEDAARLTLEALEAARTQVGALYDHYPENLLTVVLYAGESFESVRHVSWSSAYYDGRVRMASGGAAAASARFRQTLFHEYGHGVFDRATKEGRRTAPGWLNEGLACVAGNLVAPLPLGGCRMGHAFPIRKLEGAFASLDRGNAHPAYLEARHAAERLREVFGEARVQELMRELAKRKNFEAAFEATFAVGYPKWAEQFDAEAKAPP